jgi:hypothetical protein
MRCAQRARAGYKPSDDVKKKKKNANDVRKMLRGVRPLAAGHPGSGGSA